MDPVTLSAAEKHLGVPGWTEPSALQAMNYF